MALYEYYCHECGNRFDALRTMRDADSPIQCQKCNSNHTSRLISVFYAKSGGRIVAGDTGGGCASCSAGSCSSCGL